MNCKIVWIEKHPHFTLQYCTYKTFYMQRMFMWQHTFFEYTKCPDDTRSSRICLPHCCAFLELTLAVRSELLKTQRIVQCKKRMCKRAQRNILLSSLDDNLRQYSQRVKEFLWKIFSFPLAQSSVFVYLQNNNFHISSNSLLWSLSHEYGMLDKSKDMQKLQLTYIAMLTQKFWFL